jgi:hypothetical protein
VVGGGGPEHPLLQRHDEAVVLGERDELVRRDGAEHRVVPAHEGLDADDPALGEAGHRLVLQAQLTVLQRAGEVARQLRPAPHRVVERTVARRAGEADAALAGCLRRAQREVRGPDGTRGVLLGHQLGDTDAARHGEDGAPSLAAVRVRGAERPVEQRQQPLGQRGRLLGRARDDEGELVTAEPGDEVTVARGRAQPVGHLGEQQVPGLVAGHVVDDLEAVEVDEQHAGRLAGRGTGAGRLEGGHQPGPVGQSGEVVGPGHPLELALGGAPVGHVPQVQHDLVVGRALDAHAGGTDDLDVAAVAGRRPQGHGGGQADGDPGEDVPGQTGQHRAVADLEEVGQRPAGELVGTPAELLAGAPGHPGHPAVGPEDHGDVLGAGHQGAHAAIGAQQAPGQPLAVGGPQQAPHEREQDEDADPDALDEGDLPAGDRRGDDQERHRVGGAVAQQHAEQRHRLRLGRRGARRAGVGVRGAEGAGQHAEPGQRRQQVDGGTADGAAEGVGHRDDRGQGDHADHPGGRTPARRIDPGRGDQAEAAEDRAQGGIADGDERGRQTLPRHLRVGEHELAQHGNRHEDDERVDEDTGAAAAGGARWREQQAGGHGREHGQQLGQLLPAGAGDAGTDTADRGHRLAQREQAAGRRQQPPRAAGRARQRRGDPGDRRSGDGARHGDQSCGQPRRRECGQADVGHDHDAAEDAEHGQGHACSRPRHGPPQLQGPVHR